MSDEYPLQVITISERDHHKPYSSGGPKKVFSNVTPSLRSLYSNQISSINQKYKKTFHKWPNIPNIARVELKKEAIAKSHRPSSLLNNSTCPIIGDYGFGKLLIRVNEIGLEKLNRIIEEGTTKENIANISSLESFLDYSQFDRIDSSISIENFREIKISLFDFKDTELNNKINKCLLSVFEEIGILKYKKINYGKNQIVYKAEINDNQTIPKLCIFPPVRTVSLFPQYETLKTTNITIGDLHEQLFPKPDKSVDYPIVGIIDTGIHDDNKALSDWVVARKKRIIDKETDFEHGSFVGGLIANNHSLNHSDPRFPNVHAKIIDIRALSPKNGISEEDLKETIEDSIKSFPYVRIWNLSLGASTPTDSFSYSSLASYFDELQDTYNVLFVISAGNYTNIPLRNWPPSDISIDDRISTPGDSSRALSVGSITHKFTPITLVRNEEPSPFSRRGPGPSFIPKPEIIHYGGNCDKNGNYSQTGVLSVSADSKHSENIGTSFSTPIVSSIASQYTKLISGDISKELIKALVIHSAVLDSPIRTAEEVKYYGFGKPLEPIKFLTGDPFTCTMIFEGELYDSLEFSRQPFPLPESLRADGKFHGELLMTLVYSPPTDSSFLAEYCRSNIEVSLGIFKNGKHSKKVPIDPKDINKLYESEQIEHGFKWSPVKVYRRIFPRGCSGDIWRLKLNLQRRFETHNMQLEPQKFALLVSVRDHEKNIPIFNEMVKEMNSLGWNRSDLRISDRARVRN